jgi:hypothetical protein
MRASLLLLAAACSNSFLTGQASLSGGPAQVSSASSGSSGTVLADGGNALGWSVRMVSDPPGTDCFNPAAHDGATIAIYTAQIQSASHRLAQVPLAQIPIGVYPFPDGGPASAVTLYAPDGGSYVATSGSVTVTAFSTEEIRGTLSITGTSLVGTDPFTATGTFVAPACGKM